MFLSLEEMLALSTKTACCWFIELPAIAAQTHKTLLYAGCRYDAGTRPFLPSLSRVICTHPSTSTCTVTSSPRNNRQLIFRLGLEPCSRRAISDFPGA